MAVHLTAMIPQRGAKINDFAIAIDYILPRNTRKARNFVFFVEEKNILFSQNNNEAYLRRDALGLVPLRGEKQPLSCYSLKKGMYFLYWKRLEIGRFCLLVLCYLNKTIRNVIMTRVKTLFP